jgi:hypothetical protein
MNDKPRMVTVVDDELAALLKYGPDDLGTPTLYKCGAEWKANADELRRWRAGQPGDGGLQNTSQGQQE